MAREIFTRTGRSARKSIKFSQVLVAVSFSAALLAVALIVFFKKPPQEAKSQSVESVAAVSQTPTPEVISENLTWPDNIEINPKILMYHHVGPLPSDADDIRKGLTVSPENFELQLKFLKDNGYQTMTLDEMYAEVAGGGDVSRVAVLTFDDGYDDNFTYALPLLEKYDAKGTFFIISGKIGKSEYMNSDQIKSLVASGNEIGSHSVTHPSLEKISENKLKEELTKSQEDLEKLIDQKIKSFCYPSGKYSENVIAMLKESGYKIAVTTQKGQPFSTAKPYEVPRYRINPNTTLENLF